MLIIQLPKNLYIEDNMAKVSTYLNFPRNTEKAFNFYKSVFGGEFAGGIHRFSEVPPQEGQPPMAEADKNLVMHIARLYLVGTCSWVPMLLNQWDSR